MVFLIQNTQNRDGSALQLKIDELLRAVRGAQNAFINLEDLSEDDLNRLKEQYSAIAARARGESNLPSGRLNLLPGQIEPPRNSTRTSGWCGLPSHPAALVAAEFPKLCQPSSTPWLADSLPALLKGAASLFSQNLFNLADFLLDLAGYLFALTFRLQVRIVGDLADLLFYFSFSLVKLTFQFVLRTWFHFVFSSKMW
jgi:Low affinity iron permease